MVRLTYYLADGVKGYKADNKPNLASFKSLYKEFKESGRYQHYDLFVFGGFAGYLLKDPQWDAKDINIFIGRKKIVDTQDLCEMMTYLLELGEKYKVRLDIKYFTEHESPFTLNWGSSVQYLTLHNKVKVNDIVDQDSSVISIEIDNNLFVVDSTYQMVQKDLARMNKGLTLYKGVELKKHKF